MARRSSRRRWPWNSCCGTTSGPDPAAALAAVELTLDRMARGGIFDQLGGGFSRYSVDRTWHVPHFEKMLDDNAQLLRLYAHHHRLTGSAQSARVADDGGRVPAAGAAGRSPGRSPRRWTRTPTTRRVRPTGGPARSWSTCSGPARPPRPPRCSRCRIRPRHRPDRQRPGHPDPDELAGEVLRLPVDPPDLDDPDGAFAAIRRTMLAARERRPQPDRDDIVVLRSNGLVIAALAEAGAALDRPDWVEAARSAADHLSRCTGSTAAGSAAPGAAGSAPARAVLADLGDLACGLLALYQATGDRTLLDDAVAVVDAAPDGFRRPGCRIRRDHRVLRHRRRRRAADPAAPRPHRRCGAQRAVRDRARPDHRWPR